MPKNRANVKNEKQYEALKDKGMSKARGQDRELTQGGQARRQEVGKGGNPQQGGTTAQKKAAGRKGGKASAEEAVVG